jgi:hypothetical protein
VLSIESVFKDFHCIYKAAITHRDNHIDRIEVFLAFEASGQICFVIGSRMKIVTQGATEPDSFAVLFHLKVQQIDNDFINGDIIAQHPEKIIRVIL